jgi:peptidoglycan/LPS O-acetylase OafA/YrhL
VERGRVAYIDGLRAVAVLGVVACHAALVLHPIPRLTHVLTDGAHGVDLFFVLSGFCLAYPTLRRLRASGTASFDIIRYAAHRLVRIVPPYYLAIAVIVAAAALVASRTGVFQIPGAKHVTTLGVVAQAFFLDRGTALVAPPFWTLMVEFRWYFAFPLLLALYVRSERAYWLLIAGVVAAYWLTRLHDTDLGVLPAFMLGIVAADWHLRRHPLTRYAIPLACIALVIGFLEEPLDVMPNPYGKDEAEFYFQTLTGWHFAAFFFVLAASREGSLLQRVLSARLPAAIGLVSYSIYLIHYPVVMGIAPMLEGRGFAVAFLVSAVLAVIAGAVFWVVCERPFCGGASRERWVARVAPVLRRGFAFFAIPLTYRLADASRVTAAPAEPEQLPERAPVLSTPA